MSVKINGKDFTKYIDSYLRIMGDKFYYGGKVIENERIVIERMLKDLSQEMPIRVEDTKFSNVGLSSGIYKITSISSQRQGSLLKFKINFEGV